MCCSISCFSLLCCSGSSFAQWGAAAECVHPSHRAHIAHPNCEPLKATKRPIGLPRTERLLRFFALQLILLKGTDSREKNIPQAEFAWSAVEAEIQPREKKSFSLEKLILVFRTIIWAYNLPIILSKELLSLSLYGPTTAKVALLPLITSCATLRTSYGVT